MRLSRLQVRRLGVVFLLLAVPGSAQADALDGVTVMFELLAAVTGVAVANVAFTLWAYLRPQVSAVQWVNRVLVILSLLLGAGWEKVFSGNQLHPFSGINPFLGVAVPLAVWLGAVSWARQATTPERQVVWVGVAVFGAQLLLSPLLNMVLRSALGGFLKSGYLWLWWLVSLPLAFGVWWLVLEQVQHRRPLGWHQTPRVLQAPAIEAVLSILYSFFSIMLTLGPGAQLSGLSQFAATMLGYALLGWAVGVAAIWFNQRRRALA